MKKQHTLITIILILVASVFLPACKANEIQTEDFVVTPVSTQQPLRNRPEVTDEIVTAMRENMEWTLTDDHFKPYQTVTLDDGKTIEFISLYLVSSGIFDATTVTLDDGSVYYLDILYAYQLNYARGVIVIPLVVGFGDEAGGYTYFSEQYIYGNSLGEQADPIVLTQLSPNEAIQQDAIPRLPKGTILSVHLINVFDRNSPDWKNCPVGFYASLPNTYCQIAAQTDYGYTSTIINRAATSLPDEWVMVGWFFSERPNYGTVIFGEH